MSVPPALWGEDKNYFAAYSFRSGRWQRIALQIDERNDKNEYVLQDGLPFTKYSDDGRLDKSDQIVLLGEDFGADFSASHLDPSLPPFSRAFRLDLGKAGDRVSALLLRTKQRPSPSPRKDVRLNLSDQSIETPHYRYVFNHQAPALIGSIYLPHKELGERLVVRGGAFNLLFKLPWWLPDFSLNKTNFSSSLESWEVGPIRTIVAVGAKLLNFLSIFQFHMYSELVFYSEHFQIPTNLEFPESPRGLLKEGSGIAYVLEFPLGFDELRSNLPESIGDHTQTQERYTADLSAQWGEMSLDVKLQNESARRFIRPFLLPSDAKSELAKVGVFVDYSRAEAGIYAFALDLSIKSLLNPTKIITVEDEQPEFHEWKLGKKLMAMP